MNVRPIQDSHEDYFAVKQMYNDWKQLPEHLSFSYQAFVQYIRHLTSISSMLFVVEDVNGVIASCKIILEPKLVYGTWICHVEDVVVAKHARKKGIGTFLLQTIQKYCHDNQWSDNIQVYKVRLGCSVYLEPFYQSAGFHSSGHDMVYYISDNKR